jgi:hypothetical protein
MSDFDFIPFDGRQDLIEFTDGNSGEAFYYSADGDEYYNAKGEKLKGFFNKFKKGGDFWQKGVGKGVSKVAKAIASVSRKILGKSKEKDKGTKEERKAEREKKRTGRKADRELRRQQNEKGENTYQENLPKADANTPDDKKVVVGGETYSKEGVPNDKQVVITKDQQTGQESVGVEYNPNEVVAVKGDDGNYSYYRDGASGGTNTPPPPPKMSTTTKIAIAVGGVAVLGVIVYLITKKK